MPLPLMMILPVVARLATISSLGRYAKTMAGAKAGAIIGNVYAVSASGAVGTAAAAYGVFHEKSTWFSRKDQYDDEEIRSYLNIILEEIVISLDDIEDSDEIVKGIKDEISKLASSSEDKASAADRLEAILVHLNQEISDVYAQLPPDAQAEIKYARSGRPKWNDEGARQEGETPPRFIKRVYFDLLEDKSLSRNQLRKMDMPLYTALANWLRKNDMPADLDLPTKSETIDREGEITPDQVKEARRVLGRWSYRTQRATRGSNENSP